MDFRLVPSVSKVLTIKGAAHVCSSLFFPVKMSRQVIARDVLILGDSNIRRYLYRSGGAYAQTCDCGMARSLTEFGNNLKMVESTNYRIVVFAMLTNIVIDAGSTGNDHFSRMEAIDECVSPLLENLR